MADMMSTLKGFLGNDAEDKIKKAMELLSANQSSSSDAVQTVQENTPPANGSNSPAINLTPESLQMISQIKGMIDNISSTNDSRSELLRSLKPFVREERQRSIDKAIRLINIGRFSGIIGR
jgi:hypothetical protein